MFKILMVASILAGSLSPAHKDIIEFDLRFDTERECVELLKAPISLQTISEIYEMVKDNHPGSDVEPLLVTCVPAAE